MPLSRRTWIVAALTVASACASDVGKIEAPVAHPGPWDIPEETAAIGDTMYVENTQAGPWVGESGCSGGLTQGARELRSWLLVAFPQITSIGGYNCRPIEGTSTMSVHGTGRALDLMIPMHSGDADNDLGDPIGNWLIEHAEEIGIQYIIWDRWTWNAARPAGNKERSYGGVNPHVDHLHIELSVDGGAMRTPWFSGPRTLPEVECPPLPAEGGIVEETSPCFRAFGPAAYWRSVSAGHGGSMLWTNAFQSETPSNWARWHLAPSAPGRYSVEIYAEPAYSVHRATRYRLRHAGVDHDLVVDLSGASGWVELGRFDFDASGAEHLSVYDHSPTPVPPDQHIPADAVRLTPVSPEPDPAPEPGPRVLSIAEAVEATVPWIEGGDPTIDDDPHPSLPPDGATLVGTCTAGRPSGGGPAGLVLALSALALVTRRRRWGRATP
ncbi:MAG TPA: hypothetical protein VIL20_25320 [Sandaracinaceae bacterium]